MLRIMGLSAKTTDFFKLSNFDIIIIIRDINKVKRKVLDWDAQLCRTMRSTMWRISHIRQFPPTEWSSRSSCVCELLALSCGSWRLSRRRSQWWSLPSVQTHRLCLSGSIKVRECILTVKAMSKEMRKRKITNTIKQHLTSGDLSSAFQFTKTKANYISFSHFNITKQERRPKIEVEAPTEKPEGSHKAEKRFPPIL